MECDLLHNEDGFPSCAILSLMVKDPREYKDEEAVNDSKIIAVSTVDEVAVFKILPYMLLRIGSADDRLKGWSIILPLSWVKAFWIPLISKGAHAIGLREKHWIANNAYLPNFLWDYPDCNAYTSLMAIEAAASHSKAERHPPAVRALKVPIPPPWSAICPFDKAYTAGVDTLISSERRTSSSSAPSSLTNSSSGVTSSRLQDHTLEDNEIGLQMPQSAAASYFKEVCPGEWEIQVPEDPIAKESHCWPIGFVTTGFVWGSEKPTAEAFCEITNLNATITCFAMSSATSRSLMVTIHGSKTSFIGVHCRLYLADNVVDTELNGLVE
ncbi:hypothetical protein NL676_027469 [Syzygium grande]|nr:hypothetical protein NL676_027469 [Syzygium grande]